MLVMPTAILICVLVTPLAVLPGHVFPPGKVKGAAPVPVPVPVAGPGPDPVPVTGPAPGPVTGVPPGPSPLTGPLLAAAPGAALLSGSAPPNAVWLPLALLVPVGTTTQISNAPITAAAIAAAARSPPGARRAQSRNSWNGVIALSWVTVARPNRGVAGLTSTQACRLPVARRREWRRGCASASASVSSLSQRRSVRSRCHSCRDSSRR